MRQIIVEISYCVHDHFYVSPTFGSFVQHKLDYSSYHQRLDFSMCSNLQVVCQVILKSATREVLYPVFRVDRITFFLVNRVENQNEPKRPQSGGRLGSFWFSTRPTAMGGTDYNQHHALESLKCSEGQNASVKGVD